MFSIHLLRVRCEPLLQKGLFETPLNPAQVIVKSLLSAPTGKVGRGSEWHIGKPELIAEEGGVGFKMGRRTAVTLPQYDKDARDFFEEKVERAPYTFGVFDAENQTCGIVRRSGVSQSAVEIASKLEKILNASEIPNESGFRIVVDPIRDPQGFIEQLQSAAQIKKFSFTSTFPNPFDVEELIQRPAEEFTKIVGGTKTKVEVNGENLSGEVLEELSRGVASTGDEASATILEDGKRKTKRVHLKGNPILEAVEVGIDLSSVREYYNYMLKATKSAYKKIRRSS